MHWMSYFGNFHMLEQTRVQVEKFDIGANKGVWAALVHCWLLFAPAFIKNNLCRREQTTILGEFWLQKMWISTPRWSLPATSPQPSKNSDSSSSKETDHLDWWEIETPRYPTLISETCHFLLPHFNAFILPSFTVPTVHPSLWPGFYSLGLGLGVKVCFARFQRWLSPNWSDATNGLFATRP